MSDQERPDLSRLRAGLRLPDAPSPEAMAAEERELAELDAAPRSKRWGAFLRRGGPGYLQSAMTLGGGTALSAVFAGRVFGYELLWVAPVAMLFGIVVLSAVAHQTLSTGVRPFDAMRRFAGAPFAWAWALGALVASIIWHFPQYALAGAALSDLADAAGAAVSPSVAAWPVLAVAVATSLAYGRSTRAVRLYERFVQFLVWAIVASFLVVVLASAGNIEWGAVLRGFVPSVPGERGGQHGSTLIASGLAAAVGINMVFLYPYSLLARGWGRAHRSLARFDLFAGMLVPYTLAASLILIATASTIPLPEGAEATKLAPVEAARALGGVLGEGVGRAVFDLGLVGMALSTITLHMVCSGFVVVELTGCEVGSRTHVIGTLLPTPAVLGPMLWQELLWIAVPTNIVCGLFLPLAYVGFIRMQRSERYLGRDKPRGALGAAWLVGLVAITVFLAYTFVRYVVENWEKLTG